MNHDGDDISLTVDKDNGAEEKIWHENPIDNSSAKYRQHWKFESMNMMMVNMIMMNMMKMNMMKMIKILIID